MKPKKLLHRLSQSQTNVKFGDLMRLALALGFRLDRTVGSHHILVHPDLRELLNLQDCGGDAKPSQVRQLLNLVEEYNLTLRP